MPVAIGDSVEQRLELLAGVDGVEARSIGPEELSDRIPLLAPYDGPAMVDEGGGAIRTRSALDALAGALGDAILAEEVISLRTTENDTVEVRTVGARAEHDRAVVCAGRHTGALARGLGLSLPITLGAHVRITFALKDEPPARLSSLQDSSGAFGESGVYASEDAIGVWDSGRVLFVAGHNLFKQAPGLGRVLASAATDGEIRGDFRPEARLGQPS